VERTTPLIYVRDGDRVALVASNAGDDKDPNWWQNLKKQPRAKVQIGSQIFPVTARQARPEEQSRLWPQFLSVYRTYDDYRKKTSRPIPVVILDRL
jgi:deazaflavin-dependent oxidoreductase (nitroreductase family)